MKKLLYIFISLTLFACGGDDDNEPQIVNIFNGDLTITTQEEVDNFAYTEINGVLTIEGLDITNLESLIILSKVNENITIKNTSLENLLGLEKTSSNEELGFRIGIYDNMLLSNISGLSKFSENNHLLEIVNNPSLNSLSGISSQENASIRIIDTPIEEFASYNDLQFISQLWLDNVSVNGLSNLFTNKTLRDVKLFNINTPNLPSFLTTNFIPEEANVLLLKNLPLNDLNDFSNIEALAVFTIQNLPNITNLEGLDGLKRVFELHIIDNPQLTSLNGVDSFTGSEPYSAIFLSIQNNVNLNDFCAISNYLNNTTYAFSDVSGVHYYVQNNAYNPNQDEIKTPEGCSQ